MLLTYGVTRMVPDWHVTEPAAAGYSRMYWVHSGTVRYRDGERTLRLREGVLYLFPSTAPYVMTHDPANPLVCLFLHLNFFPGTVPRMSELGVEEGGFLHRQLQAMEICAARQEDDLAVATAAVLEAWFRREGLVREPDPALSELLLYIAANLRQPLTLEGLSRIAGYHPQYFVRYFKKRMGVTPYRYVLDCRMKEAQRLLQEGCSVTEAAAGAGYADLKTFEQAFRNRFGTAPGHWRSSYHLQP